MVARLDPAPAPGWPHRLQLGSWQAGADPCEAVLHALGADPPQGRVVIEAGAWPLQCSQLQAIAQRLEQAGLQLEGVSSWEPSTLVASAAVGLRSEADTPEDQEAESLKTLIATCTCTAAPCAPASTWKWMGPCWCWAM